ncbi:hypothetical protein [Spirillospora sp. CA-128828]|uniref:hypothetical protein n=1 Tax=Spirillospora sp. CA-128828 TaxID=3240033 RepID=UPI003D90C079
MTGTNKPNPTPASGARHLLPLTVWLSDQMISSDGLAELLHQTGELAHAVVHAHPDDKADLYAKLGLKMTYYPGHN